MTVVKVGDQLGSALAQKESNFGFYGPNINWTSGGRFTLTPYSNYVPSNGDSFVFADPISGNSFVTPAGFLKYKQYYMVNLSGNQFDLAKMPGGTPIQLSDSYSGTDAFYIVATAPPTTGSIGSIGYPTSYTTEVLGMLNYASAAGTTVASATLTDLTTRNKKAGNNFTSDPKWGMTTTFIQNTPTKRRNFLTALR